MDDMHSTKVCGQLDFKEIQTLLKQIYGNLQERKPRNNVCNDLAGTQKSGNGSYMVL